MTRPTIYPPEYDFRGGSWALAPATIEQHLDLDLILGVARRWCAGPAEARVDPAPRTGPARSWVSCCLGCCRPVGADAWWQLVQQRSRWPPLVAAAARLSFVFEPRVPAMGSGWRLPARPDVFSGCCGFLLMFATFSVSGCSCASLSTLRYRQQSSHAVPTTHSVLSVGAAP